MALRPALIAMLVLLAPVAALASEETAASCSYSDVSDAITAAGRNGTVNIPAGSCTWGAKLRITHGIRLHGAGRDSTLLTLGTNDTMLQYTPDATAIANDEVFEVSDLELNFNNQSCGFSICFGISNTSATTPITNVILHDLRLKNTSSSNRCFSRNTGDVYGVFYNSEFVDCSIDGGEISGNQSSWDNHFPCSMGGTDQFYYEDITAGGTGVFFHDAGQGGRYAVRFSTYTHEGGGFTSVFDMHGNQGANFGTMCGEFYRMVVAYTSASGGFIGDLRGGVIRMFDLTHTATSTTGAIQIREEACDHSGYTEKVNDSYFWGNTVNGSQLDPFLGSNNCGTDLLAEDDEYFIEKSSFDGTSGVGIGVLADIPATCTTGVGYWATDQGSWNTSTTETYSDTPGADGVLYKCTSTDTWEAYYTPLEYPHPLRVATEDTGPLLGLFLCNIAWPLLIFAEGLMSLLVMHWYVAYYLRLKQRQSAYVHATGRRPSKARLHIEDLRRHTLHAADWLRSKVSRDA